MPYQIHFLDDAEEHLTRLTAGDRRAVLDAIAHQLTHEPSLHTKNRIRMRENLLAQYRLRVAGRLRVYYDVEDAEHVVVIKAIGFKNRDKVIIGGEEIEL